MDLMRSSTFDRVIEGLIHFALYFGRTRDVDQQRRFIRISSRAF